MRASQNPSVRVVFFGTMSIQNELSSDIAVALLARANDDPKKLVDVKETVLRIRSVLQQSARSHSRRVQAVADKSHRPSQKRD